MKKFIIFIFALFFLSGCTLAKSNIDYSVDMSERLITVTATSNFVSIAESISPAIVGISSSDITSESVGTGVCVASGGYVLTNAHVIVNPSNIKLHLFNKQIVPATLIYNDSASDLAILQTTQPMPYLPLADATDLNVGEEVLAVGTPLSLLLKHTFTKGIVSATNRTLTTNSLAGVAYMHNLIQHDASINPGNSGGPLINKNGQVIGINTLKISSSEGLGFAIPVKNFENLLKSITSKVNFTTPYLGLHGYDAEIANYYQQTTQQNGVYVLDVAPNSPLISLVQSGDIITKLNNTTIHTMLDLRNALFSLSANNSTEIEVITNGKKYRHTIHLSQHPINRVLKTSPTQQDE